MAKPLLDRDDLDALADRAAEADDPAAVAAQLTDAVEADRVDRADVGYAYLLAAEIHEEADDLEQALALVERGLGGGRGGGPAGADLGRLRSCRERLLLQLGRGGEGDPAPASDPFPDSFPEEDPFPDEPEPAWYDRADDSDAVLLVWPREAYEQVDQRWPEVLEPTGAESWEEYRRRCQAAIVYWTKRGRAPLLQVTGDADEFEEWLAGQSADPFGANLATLARGYADYLAEYGDPVELPPGDDDPCWCGSGGRYAECCLPLSP